MIERHIRTVNECTRTLLVESGLAKFLWAEAVGTAVYVLNRVLSSANQTITPFEGWFNIKPNVSNLHTFGEKVVVKVQGYRRKLDAKEENGFFVGATLFVYSYQIEMMWSRRVISALWVRP